MKYSHLTGRIFFVSHEREDFFIGFVSRLHHGVDVEKIWEEAREPVLQAREPVLQARFGFIDKTIDTSDVDVNVLRCRRYWLLGAERGYVAVRWKEPTHRVGREDLLAQERARFIGASAIAKIESALANIHEYMLDEFLF